MTQKHSSNSERAFYYFIAQATNAFISFLFAPILVRSLSSNEFGVYGQTALVGEITAIFFGTGFYQIANSLYAKHEDVPSQVFSSIFVCSIIQGFIGSALLFVTGLLMYVYTPSNNLLGQAIMCYSATTLFFTMGSSASGALMYAKDSRSISYIVLLSNFVRIIAIFTLLKMGYKILPILGFICVLRLMEFILLYIRLPKTYKHPLTPNKEIVKEMIKPVARLSLSNVLGISHLIISGLMISLLLDEQQFAYYRGGAIDIFLVGYLAIAINAVLGPTINQLVIADQVEEAFRMKRKGVSQVIAFAFPFICWFLLIASPFFKLYLTPEYEMSGIVFAFFNLPLLIKTMDYTDMLIAKKDTKFMLYAYIAFAILLAILNYFMIINYGIVGATLSNAICFYVLYTVFVYRAKVIYNRKLIDLLDVKKIFQILIISVLGGIVCNRIFYYTHSYLYLIAVSAIILPAIYLFLIWKGWIDLSLFEKIAGKYSITNKFYNLLRRVRSSAQ